MAKNKQKVYCGECKYYESTQCESPNNLKDTYLAPKARHVANPYEKNKDNNCKDFVRK